MKKITMTCTLLLALCLVLTGCITINLGSRSAAPAVEAGQEIPAVFDGEDIDQLEPLFDEFDLDTTSAEEASLGVPLQYDEVDEDEEEYEPDIPRTIVPAGDADQKGTVRVDYAINDDQFAAQIDELAYYADDYIGKNISLVGHVLLSDADSSTQFAVVRDYQYHDHDHELDPDHDHSEDEIGLTGIDCYYEGDLPAEDAWVRVIGTLTDYEFADEDGETYGALMLAVQFIETVPEAPVTAE